MAIDYEQQRLHLLHKHGVDLEDVNALQDGMRTKRMNRKDIELLMGGEDGEGGVFTWREKHGRKVGSIFQSYSEWGKVANYSLVLFTIVGVFYVRP